MARVVFHENSQQGGSCLPGAMRDYMQRISLDGVASLDWVWEHIRTRPFESDRGEWQAGCPGLPPGARAVWTPPACQKLSSRVDNRCVPAQRSRVWPPSFNCWEATAHFVRAAAHFLPTNWVVHVWDRDLVPGMRHVWPSLMTPQGDHLLVDLESVAPRTYAPRLHAYTGVVSAPANAEWWQQALGGVHYAGDKVLRVFNLGEVSDTLEELEGDNLPDWARRKRPAKETKEGAPSLRIRRTANPTPSPERLARGSAAPRPASPSTPGNPPQATTPAAREGGGSPAADKEEGGGGFLALLLAAAVLA